VDEKNQYPVKPEDLDSLVALIEASPTELSYRMKLIEQRLAGKQKMVLTTSASGQAERWKSVSGISGVRLWEMPYQTIERRSRLKTEEVIVLLHEFLRFYALPGAPLAKGRLLHLKDMFSGQEGATGFYQAARPSFQELGYLSELPTTKDLDKIGQDLAKIKTDMTKAGNDPTTQPSAALQRQKRAVEERIADVELAKMVKRLQDEYAAILMKSPRFGSDEERQLAQEAFQQQALRIMLTHIVLGKQDATYWLGLIAYERGNFSSAEDYFSRRILEKFPNSPWRHGALYNFARSIESAGQIERAAMIYQSDAEAPDAYGRQLRARWLLEKNGQ
jgi:hypothetical protein